MVDNQRFYPSIHLHQVLTVSIFHFWFPFPLFLAPYDVTLSFIWNFIDSLCIVCYAGSFPSVRLIWDSVWPWMIAERIYISWKGLFMGGKCLLCDLLGETWPSLPHLSTREYYTPFLMERPCMDQRDCGWGNHSWYLLMILKSIYRDLWLILNIYPPSAACESNGEVRKTAEEMTSGGQDYHFQALDRPWRSFLDAPITEGNYIQVMHTSGRNWTFSRVAHDLHHHRNFVYGLWLLNLYIVHKGICTPYK